MTRNILLKLIVTLKNSRQVGLKINLVLPCNTGVFPCGAKSNNLSDNSYLRYLGIALLFYNEISVKTQNKLKEGPTETQKAGLLYI